MTDQNTPEAVEDDDDLPAVHFSLRNPSGEDRTLSIETRILGTSPYLLIQSDDQGDIVVQGSHLDFESVTGVLSLTLAALIQSDEIDDEIREQVRTLLGPDEEEA